jgi:hypothetical protein
MPDDVHVLGFIWNLDRGKSGNTRDSALLGFGKTVDFQFALGTENSSKNALDVRNAKEA